VRHDGVRRRIGERASALLIVALLSAVAGCTRGDESGAPQAVPSTGSVAASGSFPTGCQQATPSPLDAPISFVAQGRAWAMTGDAGHLFCLFEVRDPGPFLWGPRGDRVLLGGLEVRGVGSLASRTPLSQTVPASVAWAEPAGDGLVWVPQGGLNLEEAPLGTTGQRELTPLQGVTYLQVAVHPSGRALAFSVERGTGFELWESGGDGTAARRLPIPADGATLGAVGFSPDGRTLWYGTRQRNGAGHLEAWSLANRRPQTPPWRGRGQVLAIVPGERGNSRGALAIDVGSGCQDSQALAVPPSGGPAVALLPGKRPSSVVGWLDDANVLVLQGGCGAPGTLWVAHFGGAPPLLLARGVDRAALRLTGVETPPPLPS